MDSILEEAVRVSAEGLQVSLCKILELTGGTEPRLLVRAGIGWRPGVVGHATIGADNDSPAGFALNTGQAVISNHLTGESRFRTPRLLAEHGVRRAINVLIPEGNSPFGVLEADSPDEGRFTPHDIAFLQGVANLPGVAIERHAAEHHLAGSEGRFRGTFEQAAVGMAHVAPDGRWLRVNDRLCEITGYTRQELLKLNYQSITHPDDLAADVAQATALLDGAISTYSMEKRYVRKHGAPVWINLTVSLMRNEANEPLYFISVVEDIEARKQAEAALQELNATLEQRVAERTQELERAYQQLRQETAERQRAESILRHAEKMKVIGELTSGIAHDFNNVLTAIGGSLELALRSDAERMKARLGLAREAVGRGAKLARDLLTFSRTTALKSEVFDIAQRVAEIGEMIDRSVGDQVRVEMDFAENLWPVQADADQFELAILNAAVNARDAMKQGGIFRISARNTNGEPPMVELALSDTGSGMALEVAERAFEPFFTTKQHGGGTGLGLAQIYAFATQSGGTATIESQPGRGTTIRLHLVASQTPVPAGKTGP